jgi:hypothetical protein
MSTTTKDLHKTNEIVAESGKYVCATGETREFKSGEHFPVCPKTSEPTTWRHVNHQHKTGDKITESGQYIDKDGQEVKLTLGDSFPACPKTGKATIWKHA